MGSSSRSGSPDQPWDLIIGLVRSTHGVAGAVKVEPLTDQPQRFQRLKEVWVEPREGEGKLCAVESCRLAGKYVLAKLAGYASPEAARVLVGAYLKVKASMAITLPEGHYFHYQIIGLRARTTTGEDLGEVTEVITNPANDVYVTPKASIPALKEVVREVDLERGVMVVDLLEEVES